MSYETKKCRGSCWLCGEKAYGRIYCDKCGAARTEKARLERRTRVRICHGCGKEFSGLKRRVCNECASTSGQRFRTYQRNWRQSLKRETFDAYGGPVCACCRELQFLFLSMDHINNDGAAHRREINPKHFESGTGVKLYAWLKRHGFPPGFQVLCMNCNFGKKMNGGICPHKEK